jgi:hypothetical protein
MNGTAIFLWALIGCLVGAAIGSKKNRASAPASSWA